MDARMEERIDETILGAEPDGISDARPSDNAL